MFRGYPKLRIASRILGGIVGFLALLVALAHTPVVRRYVLKQAVEIMRNQGVRLDASRLEYNLLTLTATLNDIVIGSTQTPDLPPLARADRARVDLRLMKLIQRGLYVEDAAIGNPRLHLVIDENGRDNIPRSANKDEAKQELHYLIDRLVISGGSVHVEDRRKRIMAVLPLEEIAVDGDSLTGNHEIQLKSGNAGQVTFENRMLPIRDVSADVRLYKSAAEIRRLDAAFGESTVSLAGAVNGFSNPRFDVKARSTLGLGALAEFAGIQQRVLGSLDVTVAASGPFAELKAKVQADGRGLAVDRFDRLDVKAEADYDAAASRARLKLLDLRSPIGAVEGNADLALNSKAGASTAVLAVRTLDLGRLSSILHLPARIASVGSATIAARWPSLEFERVAGDAAIRLIPASAPAKNAAPVSGTVSIKRQGETIAVIPALRALDLAVNGQIALANRRNLSGSLRMQAANLQDTLTATEAFLGQKLLGTPVAGTMNIEARVGGTLETPSVSLNLAVPELQAGVLQGLDVSATAAYNSQRLSVADATVRWRDQAISAAGDVELSSSDPAINFTARSTNVSIESVLAGLNRSDIPAKGNVNFDAEVRGTTKRPQGEVKLAATGLSAFDEALGELRLQAHLSDQLIELKELILDKPQPGGNGAVRALGTYRLDANSFTVQAEANGLRLLSLTLPGGAPVRGEISLHAKGQGTLENPVFEAKLTANALQVQESDLGRIDLAARVAKQEAEIDASAPKFSLAAKANIGIQDPYPATFELKADNTNLVSLPIPLKEPLKGNIAAIVRGAGELKNYEHGEATAEISALQAEWNGQPIRLDGPLRARYHNNVLTLERATILARDSRMNLAGTLPLDPAGAGAVNVSAELDLATLAQYLPSQSINAKGTVAIDGSIRGNLKRIDPQLTVSLRNGHAESPNLNYPVSNATLRVEVREGAAQIETATLNWGKAVFSASGMVPFALLPKLPVEVPFRQEPARFVAELKTLDLGAMPGAPENLRGTLSVRLEAAASRPELEAISAKLWFPDLRVSVGTYSLEQKGTSEIVIENGIARIGNFLLAGPATELRLRGSAGLTGAQGIDMGMDGTLDAAIVSAFTDAFQTRGATEIHLAATGPLQQPQVQGYVQVTDGQVAVQRPRMGAENLSVRVDLAGAQATLSRLDGMLNGGRLSGKGSVAYAGGQLRSIDAAVKAEGVHLDFPEGLKTISSIDARLQSSGEKITVGGQVAILEGGFTDDLDIDKGILAAVTAPRTLDLSQEPNPFLERIRYDMAVWTENPLVINNNLAKAEITADLRLVGSGYEPGLSGRLVIEEGGELRFQERRYGVERGVITFTSDRRIEPNLDIVATTAASGFDIRLQISGVPGDTETTLTSDPSLPEPDILAVLVTGKTMDQMRGQEFAVARNQVLSYLSGRVGSTLGRGIASATGLSTVRIEPSLIAAETDPRARLTVGQNITPKLELVYSMDLVNSSDQIYIAKYDVTRRFNTSGIRQADGSFRFDFRHDLRFGGIPEPRRGAKQEQRKLGHVTILGDVYFNKMKLANKLGLKSGEPYDFFKVRRGMDRLNRAYTRENLLESNLRVNRESNNGLMDLKFEIESGSKVSLVFEGASVPDNVRDRVKQVWRSGVFDTQRAETSVEAIRAWLVREGYVQPSIKHEISTPELYQKLVVFDIQTGPKFDNVEIAFEGASAIAPSKLRSVIEQQGLSIDVHTKPGSVAELLTRFYHEMGYLDAEVSSPRYELESDKRTGTVVFPVKEGPLYRVGEVAFEGNAIFSGARLSAAVPLPKGVGYRPVLRANALQRLKELYWEQGYNDVAAEFATRRNRETGTLDITFRIAENQQSFVRDVVIEGNAHTSEDLIRTQLVSKTGDLVSLQKLGDSRRNLYRTGAYSLVDIVREEMTPSNDQQREKAIRLRVRVREIQPFQLHYGGFYDTERGPGAIMDFSNRNSLGSARVLGLRGRYDSQLREARLYFSQPLLRKFPLKTIASPYLRREIHSATEDTDPFNVDRVGFSLQQEASIRGVYLLNYGYRIERSRTYDTGPEAIFDAPLRIASLSATLTRETRDEILDAARGSFISHAIQYSPKALGSELHFVKYFGQYFKYIPLQKQRIELFSNQVFRPRLVYAGGVRVGLARGFGGQEVALSERFFAGGATTIRGFEQNSIGPVAGRQPLGGEAMLVINNELRFPLVSIFDGVGFVDVGNVYPKVSDFSLADIRKTGGFGLRARTPWFLVRLDYGIKLDRRPGESLGRLFFSIGQAF